MSETEALTHESGDSNSAFARELSRGQMLVLLPIFVLLGFAVYLPALEGPFISDDVVYVVMNPWADGITVGKVIEMFDPTGEARYQGANYAPLHLLASAVERTFFFDDTLGYHIVNVLIHCINAVLLVVLLVACGLPAAPALFGGLFFLFHPGNVEAVAWISQLKTDGALAFTLGALIVFRRHPGWATLLFAAGLLTKASAAAGLPMAAALTWCQGSEKSNDRRAWIWLAVWLLLFALYSVPQYTAIHPRGLVVVPAYEDFWVHLRTMASIGVRYLVMAYTTIGVSHAQEHPPVFSALDPWWLAAFPLTAFFLWRIFVSLRDRKIEAMFWLGAAAAFVPVSQMLPFSHPIANRYLYFLLPGLIGGTLLLLWDVRSALARERGDSALMTGARRAGLVVAIGILLLTAASASQRAGYWVDQSVLTLDAARHFPEGRSALMIEARHRAQLGDAAGATEFVRKAADLGRDHFYPLIFDEGLSPIAQSPEFRALIAELAGRYIELVRTRDHPSQSELASLSVAYFERGEFDEADAALTEAVERGGHQAVHLATQLEALRGMRAEIEAQSVPLWRPSGKSSEGGSPSSE